MCLLCVAGALSGHDTTADRLWAFDGFLPLRFLSPRAPSRLQQDGVLRAASGCHQKYVCAGAGMASPVMCHHSRMKGISRWLRMLRPYRWRMALVLVCQCGQTLAALLLPHLSAELIDRVLPSARAASPRCRTRPPAWCQRASHWRCPHRGSSWPACADPRRGHQFGGHAQLIQRRGAYWRLHEAQFGGAQGLPAGP